MKDTLFLKWCNMQLTVPNGICRSRLRAELDASDACLYGLTRDELRYILETQEVHGETFRVLDDKELRFDGKFRTRRLVLEAWDKLEK